MVPFPNYAGTLILERKVINQFPGDRVAPAERSGLRTLPSPGELQSESTVGGGAMKKKRSPRKPATEVVVDGPAIIHEKVGSRMTERTRTTYRLDRGSDAERQAGAGELQKLLHGLPGGFFHDLDDVLDKFLRESGVPDPTEGGKYPNLSHVTAALAKQENDSLPWFAARIRDELKKVERHLARVAEAAEKLSKRSNRIDKTTAGRLLKECKSHSRNAALAAYRAGVLNQEACGKFHFEETWTHGKKYRGKQSDKGRKRGVQRHKEAQERWALLRKEIKEFRETHPDLSQASAIRYFMRDSTLQEKHRLKGISFETIKSALRLG
jgi:hypothetical protein